MRQPVRSLLQVALLASALAPSLLSQAQPAEVYWADRWNGIYHRFTDLDGDGKFLSPGEVAFQVDPASPASIPALALKVTEENGQLVSYWLDESVDTIFRGVDSNGNGVLSGTEIKTFRNSGLLDGQSWPQDLDVTDDGAVWWVAGLVIANPQNGLSRLTDLNGDGDAADPGEQVVLVNGTGPHVVQHDLGSSPITSWALEGVAAAGNGVVAFCSYDGAAYRFEDKNGDHDVLDAGESILFLNATGERPDLPMNPDFADGTLRSLQTPAGFPAGLAWMASAMEDGQRVFYLGTDVSPFNSSGKNLAGEGLNALIFRAVDKNGDGDVNDAGEVKLFFNGSATDGSPNLIVLRGLDALDGGTVYAACLTPFPVLFPGPNGNTWIHRFEDLNGDGDAMDAGEKQLGIFDLQAFNSPALFPNPPKYGNYMADPWDFSVRRLTQWTDMGGGSPGSHGVPKLTGSGPLTSGSTTTISLANAPPSAPVLSWISGSSTPLAYAGGTLYAFPNPLAIFWVANGAGSLSASTPWPAGLPAGLDLWLQFLVKDPSVGPKLTLSNALKLTTP